MDEMSVANGFSTHAPEIEKFNIPRDIEVVWL